VNIRYADSTDRAEDMAVTMMMCCVGLGNVNDGDRCSSWPSGT